MRTGVHIVARTGRTPRISANGGLAVRQTGADLLHLISTAATPLGGDHVEITVEMEPGARLTLRSVAATIALPSVGRRTSTMAWTLLVDADADLTVVPSPTLIAADAELQTTTSVRADATASVVIEEQVQLGRHGEDGGRWSGRLHAEFDDVPALRHQLILDTAPGLGTAGGHRAALSTFRYPDPRPAAVSTDHIAARVTLACGGSLTTVLGRSLAVANRARADLGGV